MHLTVLLAYAAIVAATSLTPRDGLSVDNLDKVVHLLVYYIFAVLGYRALRHKRYYHYLCLAIIVYSALIEYGQSFVPGRDMSGYDIIANVAGVALGAVVMNRKYGRKR